MNTYTATINWTFWSIWRPFRSGNFNGGDYGAWQSI